MAAVVDPCDDTKGDGVSPFDARIPDGDGRLKYTLVRRGQHTFKVGGGGTLTKGLIKLRTPNLSDNDFITVVASVDGAAAPTATHVANSCPCDQPIMTVASVGTHWRLVGAAIKVNVQSDPENSSGVLRGGCTNAKINDLPNYSTVTAALEPESFSVAEGITVRVRCAEELLNTGLPAGNWVELATLALNSESPRWPTIFFDGLSATTVLSIRVTMILELTGPQNALYPRMCVSPFSSRYNELKALTASATDFPVATKGHSFRSFMKSAGSTVSLLKPLIDVAFSTFLPPRPAPAGRAYGAEMPLARAKRAPKDKRKGKVKARRDFNEAAPF